MTKLTSSDAARRVIADLEELADYLHEQIDGGDECRGRDQRISANIRTVEAAARLLAAYIEYAEGVDAMFQKVKA